MSTHEFGWQEMAKAAASDEKVSLSVTVENISENQAAEFMRMLSFMNWLGGVGASRTFQVSADGDGSFRPIIKVDGKELEAPDVDDDENMRFGFE